MVLAGEHTQCRSGLTCNWCSTPHSQNSFLAAGPCDLRMTSSSSERSAMRARCRADSSLEADDVGFGASLAISPSSLSLTEQNMQHLLHWQYTCCIGNNRCIPCYLGPDSPGPHACSTLNLDHPLQAASLLLTPAGLTLLAKGLLCMASFTLAHARSNHGYSNTAWCK